MVKDLPAIVLAVGTNGLGAVRSLGIRGLPVIAVSKSWEYTIFSSRYVADRHVVPEGPDFELRLADFLRKRFPAGGVLIPTSDEYAEFLQNHHSALWQAGFRFLIPKDDTVSLLNDKRSEVDFMQSIGVPCPTSVTHIGSGEQLRGLALPVIIKPRGFADYGIINKKNIILKSQQDLDAFLDRYSEKLEHFIAQEVIVGADEHLWVCNCLFDENAKLISAFTFHRLGTSPSHYGVTTSALGVCNPEVKALVQRIGEKIGYVGPGMFEFKYDQASREYKYIEINPRIGMCNWFDTQSCVENVCFYYCLASGQRDKLPDSLPGQKEKGFLNFFSDFYARMENRQPLHQVASVYWRILRAGAVFSTFYLRDPRPGLIGIRAGLEDGLSRLLKRLMPGNINNESA